MRVLALPYLMPISVPPNTSLSRYPESGDWPQHQAIESIPNRFSPQADLDDLTIPKHSVLPDSIAPAPQVPRYNTRAFSLPMSQAQVRELNAGIQRLSQWLQMAARSEPDQPSPAPCPRRRRRAKLQPPTQAVDFMACHFLIVGIIQLGVQQTLPSFPRNSSRRIKSTLNPERHRERRRQAKD